MAKRNLLYLDERPAKSAGLAALIRTFLSVFQQRDKGFIAAISRENSELGFLKAKKEN